MPHAQMNSITTKHREGREGNIKRAAVKSARGIMCDQLNKLRRQQWLFQGEAPKIIVDYSGGKCSIVIFARKSESTKKVSIIVN